MSRFVLDCSITMGWCFADETDPRIVAVLRSLEVQEAIVPSHWPLEVANVLACAERGQRIITSRIPWFIGFISKLPIVLDDQTSKKAFGEVLTLARTHRLTAYDAAYLELAMRTGCPLASLAASLNGVAAGLGIPLFEG